MSKKLPADIKAMKAFVRLLPDMTRNEALASIHWLSEIVRDPKTKMKEEAGAVLRTHDSLVAKL